MESLNTISKVTLLQSSVASASLPITTMFGQALTKDHLCVTTRTHGSCCVDHDVWFRLPNVEKSCRAGDVAQWY
jgi:hypothetical protein